MESEKKMTKEEMLRELSIPEDKWIAFTDTAVDIMYDKIKHITKIENTELERLLYFLNEILDEIGYDLIKNAEDFKVIRPDIKKFNGEAFIKKFRVKLEGYGFNINNDLYHFNRKNTKNYGLTVLKGISKFYGFSLKTKIKTKNIDGQRTTMRYYILESVPE